MNEDLAKVMLGGSDADVVKDYRATSPAVDRERHSHQVPNVGLRFAAARTRSGASKRTPARVQDYGHAVPRQPAAPARLGGSR